MSDNAETTTFRCERCRLRAPLDAIQTCSHCGAVVCPTCLEHRDCCKFFGKEMAADDVRPRSLHRRG